MRPLRSCTFALGLIATALSTAAAQRPERLPLDKSFDALMDSTLKLWKVPGAAVAVIKGDQVIWAKGYGYKDLDAKAPVTTKTKFAIGSVSKSFTVTALAAEVKQGKLDWDRPVRDYLPDFRMYDEVATVHMTTRDLVTHRSGLPRHDLLWGLGGLTREDIYHRLRYLEPTHEFRSYWQYQNLMFMTAGYLGGKLNGTTWEESVRELVFRPLEMNTADFSVNDLQRSPDYSFGYAALPNDSVVKLPYHVIDAIGPAGSINADVEEMANYLTMHLNKGKFRGKEIIAEKDAREMQKPQMVMPRPLAWDADEWPEMSDQQYGMGFFISAYRGHKMVEHGGNIDGFSSEVSFLPNDSLAVVVLTNMNGTSIRDFIPLLVYDRMLGLSRIDWNARFKAKVEKQRQRAAQAQAREEASRRTDTKPGHPLEDYVGVYNNPGYGDLTIEKDGDGLRMKFMTLDLPLEHYQFDVFRAVPPKNNPIQGRYRWRIAFMTDQSGKVFSLTAPTEPALGPMTFKRK